MGNYAKDPRAFARKARIRAECGGLEEKLDPPPWPRQLSSSWGRAYTVIKMNERRDVVGEDRSAEDMVRLVREEHQD